MPTTLDLIAAYKRTGLGRLGISFDAAMANAGLKICITALARCARKPKAPKVEHEPPKSKPESKPIKFWYNDY